MRIKNYIGVDPGRTGAFALLSEDACEVADMPEHASERGVHVAQVADIIRGFNASPAETVVALEWNQGRPGEVPDFAFRFGLQTGQIDALLFAMGYDVVHLASNKWTGKLGLPGKTWQGAMEQRVAMVEAHYPAYAPLIHGPRGGVLDGRVDAILIAHYMKLGGTPVGHKGGRRPPIFRGRPENTLEDLL